jgi:type I restriction enzyme S subunit
MMMNKDVGVAEVIQAYLVEAAERVVPVGYKQTEVGVIPEDWIVSTIQDLSFDLSDGNYSSKYPRSDEFKAIGVPFIRANNIKSLTVVDSDMRFISENKHREITKGHLKEGDVLITNRGEIGNLAIVPNRHIGSNINAQIVRINTNGTNVTNSYFAYYLQKEEVRKKLIDLQTGSALKQLPINRLKTLQVIIPQVEEQTAIANALSDVDALLSELEKLIAKKQAIKTATMQQLITGRTRLPQFALREDGSPKGYKQSELGEVPEDWEVLDINAISLVPTQNGLFFEPKRKGWGVPLINVGDMYKPAPIDIGSLELFGATIAEVKIFKVLAGDLLFTRSSIVPSGIAYCNVFDSDNSDVVFDSHLIRVRPKKSIVEPKFLYLSCISTYARKSLVAEAKTAIMTTIDQAAINRCPVLLPSKKEQMCIATTFSDMDSEIQALEQRLSKTRQIKQGMMQELLTGRTRLLQLSAKVAGQSY